MQHLKLNYGEHVPLGYTGKVITYNNTVHYLLNGKLHHLDGPAFIGHDGYKAYYINDKLICDSYNKNYEQYFYNSKEYKQTILLENMKRIKNIK